MVDPGAAAAILRRALDYPYAAPERSYLYRDGEAAELPAARLDLDGRTPLLAYGANAAPSALARKLAPLPGVAMPVLRAELGGFDVVYSAHVSPYGAIPGTLQYRRGAVAPVFVVYPSEEQLARLSATEPNYELRRLFGIACRVEEVGTVDELAAFVSRHGCLVLDGGEVGVAAIASANRGFPGMTEREVQSRVRDLLEPGVALEEFVLAGVDPAVASARTAALRATANPPVFDRGAPE
jgi:hypothetical protein